jgi:hypothetical protein
LISLSLGVWAKTSAGNNQNAQLRIIETRLNALFMSALSILDFGFSILDCRNRKNNDSRKDAKNTKFGKIGKFLTLRLGALAGKNSSEFLVP